ncbi:hypothetical protein ABE493_01390 [Stenotrophomonas terrae]|uniref:hypothetical protein n=1 Tax=Stenotrophomonas terrae TaxID=405446 RepID=UPI00320998E9
MEKLPEDAEVVITDLRRLYTKLREIMAAGERLKGATSWEASEYHERIKTVKAQLKDYAKTEALNLRRKTQTDAERFFFGPAVRSAASHFRMRTDAAPTKWVSELSEASSDVSYFIHKFERHFELPHT